MRRSHLYWRVVAGNALVLAAATLVLTFTPATVSFPVEATEAIVLASGVGLMLVLNALAVGAALAPLERATKLIRAADPWRLGTRLEVTGPADVREIVTVFNELLERIEQERLTSARRALAAQEGERLRVAQELHDEVGQILTVVLLRLETLARRAPGELRDELAGTKDVTREAMDRVSGVVRQLRPEALAELGLSRALAALASRVAAESGLAVREQLLGDLDGIAEDAQLVVYRVIQESLTNVVRHAGATAVAVRVERSGDRVQATVEDNGRGLSSSFEPSFGLLGMEERALLIGAALTVRNGAPGGVQVLLSVPLDRRAA